LDNCIVELASQNIRSHGGRTDFRPQRSVAGAACRADVKPESSGGRSLLHQLEYRKVLVGKWKDGMRTVHLADITLIYIALATTCSGYYPLVPFLAEEPYIRSSYALKDVPIDFDMGASHSAQSFAAGGWAIIVLVVLREYRHEGCGSVSASYRDINLGFLVSGVPLER
jgi:hypothetical protein